MTKATASPVSVSGTVKPAQSAVTRKTPAATTPLSEAAIRAMPEPAYMNEAQLEFFHRRLMLMREEVLARQTEVMEQLHHHEVYADPADRATAEEEHALALRLRERESILLRKIDDSLRRIKSKEYGYCTKTGDAIGIPRLLARPTASVCIHVKDRDEKVETHFRSN